VEAGLPQENAPSKDCARSDRKTGAHFCGMRAEVDLFRFDALLAPLTFVNHIETIP
jgi:hypothetical protein